MRPPQISYLLADGLLVEHGDLGNDHGKLGRVVLKVAAWQRLELEVVLWALA